MRVKAQRLLNMSNAFKIARLEAERYHGESINVVFSDSGRQLNFPWGVYNRDGEVSRLGTLGQAMGQAVTEAQNTGIAHWIKSRKADKTILYVDRREIVIGNIHIKLHNIGKNKI